MHLIALKLHSLKNTKRKRGYKDFIDIFDLINNNRIDVNKSEFKDLCLRYGTDVIYGRIMEFMKD